MSKRGLAVAIFASALLLSFCGACASQKEVIVVTAEGRRANDAQIDQDAFRLLPSGAVVWFRADAQELFEADFGPEVSRLMTEALPFAHGAGIDPKTDLDEVIGAMYATVGSDVVAICKGRFQKQQTDAAVKNHPKSVLGKPIQTAKFAGATMYVVEQVAMSVLTDRTMVFGTQLGVRRVLERVEEGRLDREVPSWFEALLSEGAATFQLGIDLDSQPIPATLGQKVSFLEGLRAGRLLGNFREPGLNLAGTLTYKAPAQATSAASGLNGVERDLEKYQIVLSALGINRPIQRLTAKATGKDTQVVVEVDGAVLSTILQNSAQLAAGSGAEDWLPN